MSTVDAAALDAEDILSTSLQTLYSYAPITHSSPGFLFIYDAKDGLGWTGNLTLQTPDTHASNWALHASSIWVSSVFLADHITEVDFRGFIDKHAPHRRFRRFEVLELGAGAGLPGILIAKYLSKRSDVLGSTEGWRVTLSDYPDENLIRTLEENVRQNDLEGCCRVVPYSWGSDPSNVSSGPLLPSVKSSCSSGYDLVVAADTLWNPELHESFHQTLWAVLRRSSTARVHLIAGLHTGRYTIQGFLEVVSKGELEIGSVTEREVNGEATREWQADREDGDEKERRRWVVWIVLRWKVN